MLVKLKLCNVLSQWTLALLCSWISSGRCRSATSPLIDHIVLSSPALRGWICLSSNSVAKYSVAKFSPCAESVASFCRSDPTENDSVEGLRPNARGPGLVTFGVSAVFVFLARTCSFSTEICFHISNYT